MSGPKDAAVTNTWVAEVFIAFSYIEVRGERRFEVVDEAAQGEADEVETPQQHPVVIRIRFMREHDRVFRRVVYTPKRSDVG